MQRLPNRPPRRAAAVTLAAGFLLSVAPVPAAAALAVTAAPAAAAGPALRVAAPDDNCAKPGEVPDDAVPWAQQWLNHEGVWPFSRGRGVTVAVLASGVDGDRPQLAGRVESGFDAVANRAGADTDCQGTGTQVAAVLAARRAGSGSFSGLAPDARILPVRVLPDQISGEIQVEPAVLARGITAAVDRGADIVAVPVPSYTDSPALRSAVSRALDGGVLVVAAVGDRADEQGGNPPPYPASYDGVLGVGAITQTGERLASSQFGAYVDIVAPGGEVVTLQRGGGLTVANDTGVACGLVAAAAALVRAKQGDLSPAELANRLTATATPPAAGIGQGRGIVNPYAAANDQLSDASPVALPAVTRGDTGESPEEIRRRKIAMTGAVLALVVVLGVVAVAMTVPRARRRRWRPAVVAPPTRRDEPEEPAPPVQLFDDRTPV
ncbi:S8 family serine peptidase [Plantactinospora sp. GCM10030261]|uniref:S8 family serine peptidase n=1 Tax=Plantactinospora sp. GCM10030261 TaxID=3273420 RepID=UPI00361AD569